MVGFDVEDGVLYAGHGGLDVLQPAGPPVFLWARQLVLGEN